MGVLDTFYLLFKTDAPRASKEVDELGKKIDLLKEKGKSRSEQESKDLKESVKRHKELNDTLKEQQNAVDKLKDSVASAVAAYVSFNAIKSGILDTANFNRALGIQSKAINQNADDMAAYGAAIEQAGGNKQDFFNTIDGLTKSLAAQGIQIKPVKELMDGYQKTLSQFVNHKEKLNYLQRLGITDNSTINFLLMESEAYKKAVDSGYKYRITTKEAREASEAWGEQNKIFGQSMSHLWNTIDESILPILTKFFSKLTDVVDYIASHRALVVGFFAAVTAGASALALAAIGALAPWILLGAAITAAAAALAILFGRGDDLAKLDKISANFAGMSAQNGGGGAPASSSGSGGVPLGVRNNNPGNLRKWGNAPQSGGFAVFNTPGEGIAAMTNNLRKYDSRGWNTLDSIISHWAPSSENNTEAYIAAMENMTGYGRNQRLNMSDPAVMQKIVNGLIQHENGQNPYNQGMITDAINSGKTAMSSAASFPLASQGNSNSSRTMSVKIDKIDVQTQATDANGISNEIGNHLERSMRSVVANWDDGISS